MRKLFTIIIYTLVVLLIGRNLPSLPRFALFANPKEYAETLKKETQAIIKGKTGNYSIYFADLTTGQTFGISEHEIFTGASLNKVPIVATLYSLERKGKISLDEQVTLQKDDLQDYGTGSLRYQKPGSTYSLKTLAKLSLKQSDNTAAHIIANRIGMDTIKQTIAQLGLKQTNMEANKTSAYDLYLLFTKLYNHELTTEANTKELLSFMTETDIEDRIPEALPPGTTVYHKTGDTVGSLHDAGIIEKDGKRYFLAILTSDVGDKEQETKETITAIAKHVLEFYSKRE